MNEAFKTHFQKEYSKLLVIYIGLLVGLISFSAVLILLLVNPDSEKDPEKNELFQLIVPIVLVTAVSVGIFFSKKAVAQAINEPDDVVKLQVYNTYKRLQLGLLDGAILFSNVVYLLTSNTYFIYLSIIALLYYLSLFPIKQRISRLLNLEESSGFSSNP